MLGLKSIKVILVCLVILSLLSIGGYYLYTLKDRIESDLIHEIEEGTNKKVKDDEETAIDAFKPNSTIDDYVERVYDIPAKTGSSD